MAKSYIIEIIGKNAFISEIAGKESWQIKPLQGIWVDDTKGEGKIYFIGAEQSRSICYSQISSISFDGVAYTLVTLSDLITKLNTVAKTESTLTIASVEIIRPADTTAYTAKDIVGSNVTFTNAVNKKGGQGYITKVRLMGDVSTQNFKAKLHIYSINPSAVTDNAQFALLYADNSKRLGSIELPALSTEGTGSTACSATWTAGKADSNSLAQGILPIKADTASTTLYGILETLDAFTPTSAGKYFVEITIDNI